MQCHCNLPAEGGYCERHGFYKSAHQRTLCLTDARYFDLWERRAKNPQPAPNESARKGPGDFLQEAIRRQIGAKLSAKCNCRNWIRKMNRWGPTGCRKHKPQIVAHLIKEAKKHGWWKVPAGLPGAKFALGKLVDRAIGLAEDEQKREEKMQAALKYEGPVDVVYTLSAESKHDDLELRYSLRSLEKFAGDLGRVFVVGHKPRWLTGVVHLPHKAKHANKDADIINKLLLACQSGVSERFIFASDDQLLLKPVELGALPAHYAAIERKSRNIRWEKRLWATHDFLKTKGMAVLDFDTHVFQPQSKREFAAAVQDAPYNAGNGFTVNTLALNHSPSVPRRPLNDDALILYKPYEEQRIAGWLAEKTYLNFNDAGFGRNLIVELEKLFPDPSRFEILPQRTNPLQFERVAVLTLPRRRGRLDALLARLQAVQWPFAAPEIVEGVDGQTTAPPPHWRSMRGAWGCVQGHLKILKQALDDGVQSLLVLEDDAWPCDDFPAQAEKFSRLLPDDWDAILWGGEHAKCCQRLVPPSGGLPGLVRAVESRRTHAYALRGPVIQALYDAWLKARTHCDKEWRPLQHKFRFYAPRPFLIGQNAGRSDIDGKQRPIRFWSDPPRDNSYRGLKVSSPPGKFHRGDCHSLMLREELEALLDSIPTTGAFLEIGTWHGLTASLLAQERPGVEFWSLDPMYKWDNAKWQRNRRPNMRLIVGTVADLLALGVAGRFDAALVDGDHQYAPCRADLAACETLLKTGAPLWAHDYQRVPGTTMAGKAGVQQAVDEFCRERGYAIEKTAGSLVLLGSVAS